MLKKIKTAAIVTVQVVFGVTGLMLALVAFTAASCLLFELFMNICFGIQTVSISPALRPIAINILIDRWYLDSCPGFLWPIHAS